MLELYHHGSSACAAKVRFALAEKRLKWVSHYVDILAGEQFEERFLRINPKGVVPVLVHDGRVIRESTVICEYAEEVFPDHPLYPDDPWLRRRCAVHDGRRGADALPQPACSAVAAAHVAKEAATRVSRTGSGAYRSGRPS